MRVKLPILLATLLLFVPVLASAQVYKWTDASGTTHFSQTPPPKGVKYESINTPAMADQPVAASAPRKDQGDTGAKANGGNNARAVQLERFCAQLKSNIALLSSNQSLQRMGSDGKTTPMDDKVRAQQLQQQQQRYNAYCQK